MNDRIALFGELSKVEEQADGTLKVFGVASSGARDDAGEIITSDAMKAAIPAYSLYPAIREMHKAEAAGTALEISVDADTGKTMIVAHVVDPVAILKVKTKTYRGFSVGGKVLKRDKDDPTIITSLKLAEVSLVDRPCNPEAEINMWKAADIADPEENDMSAYQPTNDEVKAKAEAMAKAAGKPSRKADFVVAARDELIKAHNGASEENDTPEVIDVAALIRAAHPALTDEALAKAVADIEAQPEDQREALAKAFVPATETVIEEEDPIAALEKALEKAKAAKKPFGDVAYADPKNSKYPIDTAAHIRAAWSYINMPKNQKDYSADELSAIKAKIVSAWKAKIDKDGPPSAEKMAAYGDMAKSADATALFLSSLSVAAEPMAKGLYTVARVAHKLEGLGYIAQSVFAEEQYEGDTDSKLPQMAADLVAQLQAFLIEMIDEEVSELMVSMKTGAPDLDVNIMPPQEGGEELIALAAGVLDLAKADTEALDKAGKRNSVKDQKHIQAAHDSACMAGASCDPDNCPEDAEKAALIVERDRLKKMIGDTLAPEITDLAKTITDLRSDVTKRDDTIAALVQDVELLKATPMPPKTAGSSLAVVEKIDDAAGKVEKTEPDAEDVEKWLTSLTPEQRAHELMKASLARGVHIKR